MTRRLVVSLSTITFALTACSTHAIIPAKLSYTYPVAEAIAYDEGGFGAIALVDHGTMDVYLPYFKAAKRHAGERRAAKTQGTELVLSAPDLSASNNKPERLELTPIDGHKKCWKGRFAGAKKEATATFLVADTIARAGAQTGAQVPPPELEHTVGPKTVSPRDCSVVDAPPQGPSPAGICPPARDGERQVACLPRGTLLLEFPEADPAYGPLQGETMWLSPTVGWDSEVFHIRGLYTKKPSKLPSTVGLDLSRKKPRK